MSVLVPEIRTIRGREYRYYRPGFDDWGKLSAELAGLGGPFVGVILGIENRDGRNASASIVDLARGLLGGIRGGVLDRLCAGLSYNAASDGEQDKWRSLEKQKARDAAWSANPVHGVLTLAWVLGVAYEGFTTGDTDLESELSELLGIDLSKLGKGETADEPGLSELPSESWTEIQAGGGGNST